MDRIWTRVLITTTQSKEVPKLKTNFKNRPKKNVKKHLVRTKY